MTNLPVNQELDNISHNKLSHFLLLKLFPQAVEVSSALAGGGWSSRPRIIITLLASFGAFFAYICRLNLSLTIDEMVIKSVPVNAIQGEGIVLIDNLTSLINTEEHTLAWIYKSSLKRYREQQQQQQQQEQASGKQVRPQSQTKHRADEQRYRINRIGGVSRLSIDFDVGGPSNGSNPADKDDGSMSPTKKMTPDDSSAGNQKGSDPPASKEEVLVRPKRPPNLLTWSEKERNDLLGAFFLGYVIFQIPAARAAEMFGAKSLFLMSGLGASLCSLVFPFAAKQSIMFAYVVRIVLGATQSALFPSAYVLLCQWLPPSERSNWLPCPSAFSRFGTIAMNLLLPMIVLKYDWETVFYVCGAATLVWCIVFIVFGSNAPNQSYWISRSELMYIESHAEPRVGTVTAPQTTNLTASGFSINEPPNKPSLKQPSVSWYKMVTNKAIIILSIVMFSSEWNNMLLLVKLPGFLGPVLNMDLIEIGFWSSVLVGLYCVHFPLSGYLASRLEAAEIEGLSSLRIRKIFEASAHAMQGIGCLMIAFSNEKTIVIAALLLMMTGRSTVGGGQVLMPPELSRDYPGTVFAFANTIANLAGVVGPKMVSWLVEKPKEHDSWFSLWIISAILFFACGLAFCIFAENSQQNYCKKPKRGKGANSTSQAQLTLDKNPVEQIFKMDAFSRVASEPNPRSIGALEPRRGVASPNSQRRLD